MTNIGIVLITSAILIYTFIMILLMASAAKVAADKSMKHMDVYVAQIAEIYAAMEYQIEKLNKRTQWIDDYTKQADDKV